MAFSHGRKFRRIAAQALTADPGEMRALIECILPPREGCAAPVLHIETEAEHRAAPAAIVAAFFADKLTGGEAADLLRQAEGPPSLKEGRERRVDPLADAIRAWGEPERCDAAADEAALVSIRENTSAAGNAVQQREVRERPQRL
jgi:hypothetical protein